jgi:hypothetical protein
MVVEMKILCRFALFQCQNKLGIELSEIKRDVQNTLGIASILKLVLITQAGTLEGIDIKPNTSFLYSLCIRLLPAR